MEITDFFRNIALAIAALLPIINPLGLSPIFLSLTPGASKPARTALARRIAINSFLLLVAATLVGSYVLIFFGLSLAVVKIAGGLLVIATGWQLTNADASHEAKSLPAPVEWDAAQIVSRSFYPLTFPLTIGPGSVSVAMTLGAGTRGSEIGPLIAVTGVVLGAGLVASAIFLCYRFASDLLRALGPTGRIVLLRLSAFILLAVGVQIFSDGLAERFPILRSTQR